jgi:coenzyme F420-0:L-glutamate ligase / coenzyme F420-1:gamma-L-glutamate ligase
MAKNVTYFAVPGIPLVNPGDNLVELIVAALAVEQFRLVSGDILVIAQKIVSKSENRYVRLTDIVPGEKAKALAAEIGKDPRYVEIVLSEASEVVRYRPNLLIVAHRLGYVMANAGIDQSNIERLDDEERVLLLPCDPDRSAAVLKQGFDEAYTANIGVIINDSFGRPWRNGIVGVALGVAGLPSLLDMIGKPDMFGRPMQVTEIAVADEIAAGASLLMGEAAEGLPVVVVRGLTFDAPALNAAALIRQRERDLFR